MNNCFNYAVIMLFHSDNTANKYKKNLEKFMTTHILPCPTHHNRQIDLAGKHSLCSPHLWNQFAGCYTSYQRQQCQTVSNEH